MESPTKCVTHFGSNCSLEVDGADMQAVFSFVRLLGTEGSNQTSRGRASEGTNLNVHKTKRQGVA